MTAGMKCVDPMDPGGLCLIPCIRAFSKSAEPTMLKIHTSRVATDYSIRRASRAKRARNAASRSPYAAGFAERGSKACAATPGIRKAKLMCRKLWSSSGVNARLRDTEVSHGTRYHLAIRP